MDVYQRLRALSKTMSEKSKTMLQASDHLDERARECARSSSLAFSAAAGMVNDLCMDYLNGSVAAPATDGEGE